MTKIYDAIQKSRSPRPVEPEKGSAAHVNTPPSGGAGRDTGLEDRCEPTETALNLAEPNSDFAKKKPISGDETDAQPIARSRKPERRNRGSLNFILTAIVVVAVVAIVIVGRLDPETVGDLGPHLIIVQSWVETVMNNIAQGWELVRQMLLDLQEEI